MQSKSNTGGILEFQERLDWNSEGMGVTQLGIPKASGCFNSRIPEGGDGESFL